MKPILPLALLCCLFLGCHHEAGPVVSEQDALNTRALAAALHFAYQTVKPADPGRGSPGVQDVPSAPTPAKAEQTDQEKYGPRPNGPEGDYGPTQYRIDVQIAGWRPEKDRELSEVRKFAEKNNLTMSVQGMNAGPRRIDCDVGVIIVEDRETLLVHQQYGWGYWKKDPLREDLLPCAGTEIRDSTGSKFPFEIIFAPLTAERLQKLWDERKPRTKSHPEGYVPRFNGTEDQSPQKAQPTPVITLDSWGRATITHPEPQKPRFEARMPPQGTGRKIVLFSAQWCGPCRPTKANLELFARSRGLEQSEWGYVDVDQHPDNKYGVGSVPTIILMDSQGNELNRITGLASFEQIEDLWLSGKRPHNLNGLPLDRTAFAVSPDLESILTELPKLVKSAGFKAALSQQFNIPLPGVGEIVIPQTLSIQAGPIAGGFKVAVESGTPAPWVRSKWMGSLYPIPITAVSVVGKKATVELRGWQDLVISLEGP